MKIVQNFRKQISLGVLSLIFTAAFYLSQNPAMGDTKSDGSMKGMEGMQMGVNETGQATTMLTPEKKQRLGVKVADVQEHEVEKTIRAVGKVAYDERKLARINLRVDGWIQELYINFAGQEVKKGEPLLTLYSPDLLATQQEYLLAKRGLEKLGASPIAEVRETGGALLSSARRRLLLSGITEKQIQELEDRDEPQTAITITAPIHGIVTKREGVKGMRVTPEMTLYEIADLSTIWILADVYESDLSSVKVGEEAAVTVDAYPGETFKGKIAHIDPYLNSQTRTVRVRVELPNPGIKLKPEMFAQVELTSKLGKGLVIPESAVLDSGVRQIAFVDQGMEMYEPKEIKARRVGDTYLVQEGLTAGDRIVTSATFLIDSESKLMASSNMMGALGMAGIKMEQAQMGKMDMNMEGMKGMPTKEKPVAKGPQSKKAGDLTLTLSTDPAPPKDGENLLRLKIADSAGKPVENAKVVFSYTMAMPGMKLVKVPVALNNGEYKGKVKFGMAGAWEVTVFVTLPGKPEIQEKFTLEAVDSMEGMPGM